MSKRENIIFNDSVKVSNFSEVYPFINKHVIENGDKIKSRNGNTTEVIDFKTTITNPYMRCVGNNGRDINIFFLLAEAMWIFTGKKDVEFLNLFNSRMKVFSDDEKNFHAPYGFRLRHHGLSSFDKPLDVTSPENNGHHAQQFNDGLDQIDLAVNELVKNSESRRIVLQIWNADLDLCTVSKDLPCNDLIMFKIRDGKLRTTIANRSNDLHWGLPTNIFQFSFLSEMIANIVGVELGTQTHNSQSLHIYEDSDIAWKMYEQQQLAGKDFIDLYDVFESNRIDMNFKATTASKKLNEVDFHLNNIIDSLTTGEKMSDKDLKYLNDFSKYLTLVYDLLFIYLEYKKSDKSDLSKWQAVEQLTEISVNYPKLDIVALSINFFVSKMTDKSKVGEFVIHPIGTL